MKQFLYIIAVCLSSFFGYAQCPSGQTLCGGVCVDLNSNSNHCGSCGNTCPPGKICIGGACSCPPGFVNCAGNCVNLNTDGNNCGACGQTCPPGKVCVGGICSTCPNGFVDCGGICVDINTNTTNCGSCGNTCPAGYICVGGICTYNTTTSISALNNNSNAVFVYPNPVSNVVNIQLTDISESVFSVKLHDNKGNLIDVTPLEKTIFVNGLLTIRLPVNLSKGIYFMCIESQQFNKVIKIVKE